MKSTGIVRKIDPLGRLVVPKELRRTLNINVGDPMEIFVEEDIILLKKFKSNNSCIITGEVLDENIEYTKGLFLSPEGAKILLSKIQQNNDL